MEHVNNYVDTSEFLQKTSLVLSKVLCMEELGFDITMNTKLVNGVGQNDFDLSSIDYADFIILMEEEFDFEFDFFVQIHTVGEMYSYIFSKEESKVNCDEEN